VSFQNKLEESIKCLKDENDDILALIGKKEELTRTANRCSRGVQDRK